MSQVNKISREENWARLALLSQAGDQDAYRVFLKELSPYLHMIAARKNLSPETADDLTQDVLISVHKALHTYEADRPIMPWLHAIIHFRLSDRFREIYKTHKFEEFDPDKHIYVTFDEDPMNEELSENLSKALATLPDKQRNIVRLLKFEGRSLREAAQQLEMSESAIKVSAHRAYKLLGTWLRKRGDFDAKG